MGAADLAGGQWAPERGQARSAGTFGAFTEYVANSPEPVALLDGVTLEVRYANSALRARPELLELLGVDAGSEYDVPAARRLRQHLSEVAESERTLDPIELAHYGPENGTVVWRIVAWRCAPRAGGEQQLVLSAHDISAYARERDGRVAAVNEMREINQRLVLATLHEEELRERAQAASDAKSAFLATMSHELRTPLTAIIGYEELLHDGVTGPVTEQQQRQLARIKQSATHLLALIDDVLTLARTEARQEVCQEDLVELAPLVEGATAIVAPLAARKGLQFRWELEDGVRQLRTDPLRLRQILVNLLSNAVKFSEQGHVTLTARVDSDEALFIVRDTGIGIPEEYREQVFDPFFQVQQSKSRRAGGSGLGLSVSRRLARLLGGDITCESDVGRGTTFTLRLPVADAAAPDA